MTQLSIICPNIHGTIINYMTDTHGIIIKYSIKHIYDIIIIWPNRHGMIMDYSTTYKWHNYQVHVYDQYTWHNYQLYDETHNYDIIIKRARVAQWVRSLDYLTTHTSLSPIRHGFAPGFVSYKKGALDSQPQVIKFTSCLPMVGGSQRVLRLLPSLKLVVMI
jgi:hypothetical protein